MPSTHLADDRPHPTPRRPDLNYDAVPRHWLGGSVLATHLVNGLNLLFPHGERFFVRSVRHYLDHVEESELPDVRGFFGQEGRHAAEHEKFFRILEEQGYEIDAFLEDYERISRRVEALFPPHIHLATTAAAEHFTASFADVALKEGLLESAHPTVRDLLQWHAAEEIEHKAVAYDVLQKVAPSYAVRVAGLVVASVMIGYFWRQGTKMLLRQDGVTRAQYEAERAALRESGFLKPRRLLANVTEYLRPDFHPWQHDNWALARRYLERAPATAA